MADGAIKALAGEVIAAATARGSWITAAESCTGGLIMGALTSVPGSSCVVSAGVVTYSNAAKMTILGVPPAIIRDYGAVSEQAARAMADGALSWSGANLAIAVTGVAGPGGGTPTKPIGTVWFAVAERDVPTRTHLGQFGDIGRDSVRERSVLTGLTLLKSSLMERHEL
jgi:nicotinamide-nucleotide amidase